MALHPLFLWILPLLLPLLLLLKNHRARFSGKLEHLPPSPSKLPIIGNLHQLGELPHYSIWQLSKKYGPVLHLQLGQIPAVMISSAEAAKEVMKTHDLATCSRPRFSASGRLTYNYSDVALAPYGEYWRQMRKLCVLELFSVKRVNSFRFIRDQEVHTLVGLISQAAASATPVNITEKAFSFTGSVVFRMAFGRSFRGSHFNHEKFHELIHEAESVFGTISFEECFPTFGWILDRFQGRHKKVERIFNTVDAFFEQVINEHLELSAEKEHEDIIDVMLSMEMNQKDVKLRKENIKAVLLDVFLAGIDSSALVASWAMAELARYDYERNPEAAPTSSSFTS